MYPHGRTAEEMAKLEAHFGGAVLYNRIVGGVESCLQMELRGAAPFAKKSTAYRKTQDVNA